MATPGTTAPVASRTVPVIVPASFCARTEDTGKKHRIIPRAGTHPFRIVCPQGKPLHITPLKAMSRKSPIRTK